MRVPPQVLAAGESRAADLFAKSVGGAQVSLRQEPVAFARALDQARDGQRGLSPETGKTLRHETTRQRSEEARNTDQQMRQSRAETRRAETQRRDAAANEPRDIDDALDDETVQSETTAAANVQAQIAAEDQAEAQAAQNQAVQGTDADVVAGAAQQTTEPGATGVTGAAAHGAAAALSQAVGGDKAAQTGVALGQGQSGIDAQQGMGQSVAVGSGEAGAAGQQGQSGMGTSSGSGGDTAEFIPPGREANSSLAAPTGAAQGARFDALANLAMDVQSGVLPPPSGGASAAANAAAALPTLANLGDAAANQAQLQMTEADAQTNLATAARGLAAAARQGGGVVTMRLHPPELGVLRVQMEMAQGTVRASFTTQNENVGSLLNHQMTHLRHALEGQGFNVERLEVQVQSPTSAQSGANAGQDDTAGDGRSRGRFEQQQPGGGGEGADDRPLNQQSRATFRELLDTVA